MQALLPRFPVTVPVSGPLVDLFVSHLAASYPWHLFASHLVASYSWLYNLATVGKLRLAEIESSGTTNNTQINRQGIQFH